MSDAKKIARAEPEANKYSRITAEQKSFVLLMVARGFTCTNIAEMMQDSDMAMAFGFTVREVSHQALYQLVKKFDKDELRAVRLQYLADMSDIRLADKKERIIELSKIALSKSATHQDRISAIKAIKAEIGEDVDKLAKALEGSGTTVVNNVHVGAVDLATAPDNERNAIRKNIGGLLQGADRF